MLPVGHFHEEPISFARSARFWELFPFYGRLGGPAFPFSGLVSDVMTVGSPFSRGVREGRER